MLTSLFGRCIGLSAVVCVLLLFFFPLAHGNFQSTHGPTTALRSKRSFLVLVYSLTSAALRVFAMLIPASLLEACRQFTRNDKYSAYANSAGCASVLRC
jgi:hypothetical protein